MKVHVSERDLLVGDCRRRRWAFISRLDCDSVLRTQKGTQGLVRLSWRLLSFQTERAMSAFGVRREKAALSSGCKPHPATAPAGSNRSSHGGNEAERVNDFETPGVMRL